MLAKRKKMSRDNPHAVKTTDAHAEYIAPDDQPLAVVGDLLLRLLAMPCPRHGPIEAAGRQETKRIHNLLRGVTMFSVTTGIWPNVSGQPVYAVGQFILWNYTISGGGGDCVTTLSVSTRIQVLVHYSFGGESGIAASLVWII